MSGPSARKDAAPTLWHVDSFTSRPYHGNPAAVVFLGQQPDDHFVATLAGELNLPATAFLSPAFGSPVAAAGGAGAAKYHLRWHTATAELPLCGHGTLAACHALWESGRVNPGQDIAFRTRAGMLHARREAAWIILDFPALPPSPTESTGQIQAALTPRTADTVTSVHRNSLDLLIELDSEQAVRDAQPDLAALMNIDARGLILTARANRRATHDFVSRFFSPATGLPEDMVTGSAHSALGPYWMDRYDRSPLLGYQASTRGGYVRVQRAAPGRVALAGNAVTITAGHLAPEADHVESARHDPGQPVMHPASHQH